MVDCPGRINRHRQCTGHVSIFAVAFYASSDEFMAANWQGIAFVDYLFKLTVCTLFFLPAYGVILNLLTKKLTALQTKQAQDRPVPSLQNP
ncbi:Inner membrane protein yhhQ [Neisseria gonorrhoeae]|uniref:Inner membrane protein yhhQ n=1 Tax=Neisseria gonorrhoeae TaxID=485 RepID=A0A378VU39_NEIGO|nr:Inner membrane protein yhhQ [Neisseria gonorrhoeae]